MKALRDPSLFLLLLANIFVIYITIRNEIPFESVVWIYYIQGFIVGLVSIARRLMLKNQTAQFKQKLAFDTFFTLFWYILSGSFVAVFTLFEVDNAQFGVLREDWASVVQVGFITVASLGFLLAHLTSSYHYRKQSMGHSSLSEDRKLALRIFPMHITIIFLPVLVSSPLAGIVILESLKTTADIVGHIWVHKSS